MPLRGATKLTFPRTRRIIPFEHGTTMDGGDLIPIHHQDILPGDSLKVKMSYVLRMLTPINPVMDNAYLSVDAYFVPYRIIWNQFKQFMGENETTFWTESNTYTVPTALWIPYISDSPSVNDRIHSLGCYFGLPPLVIRSSPDENPGNFDVSILPLRAYAQIYNYWYRNENVTSPILFSKESSNSSDLDRSDVLDSTHFTYFSGPAKSEKLPDYFTMLLPQPQKGAEQAASGAVVPGEAHSLPGVDMIWSLKNGGFLGSVKQAIIADGGISKTITGVSADAGNTAVPGNLWANIGVSALRDAIFRQHVLEIRAKAGSRYASETLPALFGVENSEALLTEAEYLGGFDKLINMTEVLSNSDTTTGSGDESVGRPVGANGAMSKTTGDGYIFNHTFSEHGIVMILATVRHRETYFQGIERRWNRLSFWDWYLPQAQGLGMQPVYKKELNIAALNGTDKSIFGYRDYGADYTFFPNRLSGYLNPILGKAGLASWTFGSVLSSNPVLNSAFMKADKTGFARTLVLQDVNAGMQFFGDFSLELDLTSVACNSQRFPGMDRI